MKQPQLITGKILKRYKRFLADIELTDNEVITVYVPNTGSMKTCWEPGWNVLLSLKLGTERKYPHTLEILNNGDSWIGINTSLTNKLAKEAIENGVIKELKGFKSIKPEVKVGKSRLDFKLEFNDFDHYVEVKNVTLKIGNDATFPDAVSKRGAKHLEELIEINKGPHQASLLFIIQREDVVAFNPYQDIDTHYAKLLKQAHDSGVKILAYGCKLGENEITIYKKLKVKF